MEEPTKFHSTNRFEVIKSLDGSIGLGMKFLESQCHEGLYTENFGLSHGDSTAWSTAYVARLLQQIDPERVKGSVEILSNLQNIDGGWGYNDSVPSDADSTANVLLFLKQSGLIDEEKYSHAIKFLKLHQHENGGISTYTQENLQAMGYRGEGWSMPHVCVTALVAEVFEGDEKEKALHFLQSQRQFDGSFPAYWWASDVYATYQAMKIIGADSQVIEYFKSIGYENIFDLSIKIQALASLGLDTETLVNELLKKQQEDGGWSSSPILKIPRPEIKPGEVTTNVEIANDKNRLFSTVNALLALQMTKKK